MKNLPTQLIKAKVISQRHLGRYHFKGHIVAVWPQETSDGTKYRVCRQDGHCDRLLTVEQARECLQTLRDSSGKVIHFSISESKEIIDRWWFELNR